MECEMCAGSSSVDCEDCEDGCDMCVGTGEIDCDECDGTGQE